MGNGTLIPRDKKEHRFALVAGNPPRTTAAWALDVLRKGQEAGYSLRHTLTEVLLALEAAAEGERTAEQALTEVAGRLERLQSALERFQHMSPASAPLQDDMPEQAALAESFVLAVKSAAKPGLAADG